MRNTKAIALSLLVTTLSATAAWSQTTTSSSNEPKSGRINSPYSRFGLGNLSESRSIGLRGMGGTASGYSSRHVINTFNPASYAYLNTTGFEFGLDASSNNVRLGDDITRSSTITVSHLNLAIPLIKNKLAVNIGYTPFSKVYYNSQDSLMFNNLQTLNSYNGEGALNYGFLGIGGGVKGFSVGLNAGYLFGNIRNSSFFNIIDSSQVLHTRSTEYTQNDNYGGMLFKAGVMYRKDFKNQQYFSIGATGSWAQKVNMTRNAYEIAVTKPVNLGEVTVVDTVSSNNNAKGTLDLPLDIGAGVHFGKLGNYDIGVDFTYADWSTFKKFDGQSDLGVGQNAYRIAVGGEIIPNSKVSTKQYLSHITYRLGGYYGKDYLFLRNQSIDYYGMTLGIQLPFASASKEQMGAVNMSLDMGNRGTISNDLAREFYIKFTIGLKINATWFDRPKY